MSSACPALAACPCSAARRRCLGGGGCVEPLRFSLSCPSSLRFQRSDDSRSALCSHKKEGIRTLSTSNGACNSDGDASKHVQHILGRHVPDCAASGRLLPREHSSAHSLVVALWAVEPRLALGWCPRHFAPPSGAGPL
eukprot:scaffold167_cov347-Prasinococcus_capsulatus_cf.AAC.7